MISKDMPEAGRPSLMAMSNDLTTKVAIAFEAIGQPTMLRLTLSMTAQQCNSLRCCGVGHIALTCNLFGPRCCSRG